MIYMDVDTAVEVFVNSDPLVSDSDGATIDETIAYNESGMDLNWNFITPGGVVTQTNVTPTTSGVYDWTHVGNGMYKIEIPASGGGSINNAAEGFGWFTGVCDNVLPWRSPTYCFRAAGLNDKMIESAYSATRGLAGTALPDAASDAAGGLPISDTGGLDLDAIKSKTDTLPGGLAYGDAISQFPFMMVLSSDHLTPATGKTVSCYISKNGGSFAATATPTATEISSGFYYVPLTATEMQAKTIALKFSAADCDQRSLTLITSDIT